MNVDELQAGPKLDQLIAEHIMGWKLTNQVMATWQELYSQANKAVMSNAEVAGSRLYDNGRRADEFKPSTDIVAAWQALEALLPQCNIIVLNHVNVTIDSRWGITADILPDHRPLAVFAETAPLAICRAALKAIGAEEIR